MVHPTLGGRDIGEVRNALAAGERSAVELTEAVLEWARTVGRGLRAFISIDDEGALAAARKADDAAAAGRSLGPLHGVPLSLKDLIRTRGMPTTAGSRALDPSVPDDRDAELAARLRRAGAVLFGKTNLNEFAYGVTGQNHHFGDVRNPWDPGRRPGGSSSGSAAAVAVGIGLGSVGTDTRGSIRIPASCCGVTGFKPTRGLVSMEGVFPLSRTLDHAGPMARGVEGVALLLEAMTGPPEGGEGIADRLDRVRVRGLRLGICPFFLNDVDGEVEGAVGAALEKLEELGVEPVQVEIPELAGALHASGVIAAAEALAVHDDRIRERPGDFDPAVLERLERGYALSALDLARALAVREALGLAYARTFEEVDVMAGPTLPGLPVEVGSTEMKVGGGRGEWVVDASCRLTAPQNMTGAPALSVPCGYSKEGMPVGLQIWGAPGRDDRVLAVGRAYQASTDWHHRCPPLPDAS